jgi:hypothetical protein
VHDFCEISAVLSNEWQYTGGGGGDGFSEVVMANGSGSSRSVESDGHHLHIMWSHSPSWEQAINLALLIMADDQALQALIITPLALK